MTAVFSAGATRGAVSVDLHPVAWWLRLYVVDLLELLGPAPDLPDDPLAALSASAASTPERPTDPALARLIPDGVIGDDRAAMEFRRFTHESLLTRKRTDATLLLDRLDDGPGEAGRETAQRLLASFNDLRLMLGTRMMVTEGDEFHGDDFSDLAVYASYLRLAWLQEELLSALALAGAPDRPADA